MTTTQKLDNDRGVLTVHVPMTFVPKGGRKAVIAPSGGGVDRARRGPTVDSALVKAVARAFRWQKMLESGEFQTVGDLAKAEKINPSYLARILRLTLLAPDIVEAILNGRQGNGISVEALRQPFPIDWDDQRSLLTQ